MRIAVCGLALVGLAFVVARAGAEGCTPFLEDDGGHIANGCYVEGVVNEIDGRTLRIGAATVVIPESPDELRWCNPSSPGDTYYRRVRVGDAASAGGTLRIDGTILASQVVPSDYDLAGVDCASGVIESTDGANPEWAYDNLPATFTMNGVTYTTDKSTEPSGSRNGYYVPFTFLAPGDAVAFQYIVDGTGARIVQEFKTHFSGEGTRVSGAVTAIDEDAQTIDVDGVRCQLDDHTHIAYPPPPDEDGWGLLWNAMPVGRMVSVTGVLRDGRILCDRLVISDTIFVGPAKRVSKRRPGRLSANGALESLTESGLVVSGLVLDGVPVDGARGATTGRRVHVDARLVNGVVRKVRLRGR